LSGAYLSTARSLPLIKISVS